MRTLVHPSLANIKFSKNGLRRAPPVIGIVQAVATAAGTGIATCQIGHPKTVARACPVQRFQSYVHVGRGAAVHRQGDAWRLPYATFARYFGSVC